MGHGCLSRMEEACDEREAVHGGAAVHRESLWGGGSQVGSPQGEPGLWAAGEER